MNIVAQNSFNSEEEVLTTTQKTGANVEKNMIFTLKNADLITIKNSEVFLMWLKEFKEYDVLGFLSSRIGTSLLRLRFMKLKNGSSLDFNPKSKGRIYINDKDKIVITYVFSAANGYGVSSTSNASYEIPLKNKELEETLSVY
jgi:hypothetical protein